MLFKLSTDYNKLQQLGFFHKNPQWSTVSNYGVELLDYSSCIQVVLGFLSTSFCRHSTHRYLDDLLNIDNPYFEQMVGQIYPTELHLNKANSSDTEAPFLT